MLDLLSGPTDEYEHLWYFDPDSVLCAHWSLFENWQRYGSACKEGLDNEVPENSPLRHERVEISLTIGLKNPRPLNHCFNGGVVGVTAKSAIVCSSPT